MELKHSPNGRLRKQILKYGYSQQDEDDLGASLKNTAGWRER
jgi:hypothetical protein